MDQDTPRAHHDMGGVSTYMCLPVDAEPHGLSEFDRTVDALRQIVARRGLMSVDELRRGIESLPPADYNRLSYYQRWLRAMVGVLIAKGVVTEAELTAAVEAP